MRRRGLGLAPNTSNEEQINNSAINASQSVAKMQPIDGDNQTDKISKNRQNTEEEEEKKRFKFWYPFLF